MYWLAAQCFPMCVAAQCVLVSCPCFHSIPLQLHLLLLRGEGGERRENKGSGPSSSLHPPPHTHFPHPPPLAPAFLLSPLPRHGPLFMQIGMRGSQAAFLSLRVPLGVPLPHRFLTVGGGGEGARERERVVRAARSYISESVYAMKSDRGRDVYQERE